MDCDDEPDEANDAKGTEYSPKHMQQMAGAMKTVASQLGWDIDLMALPEDEVSAASKRGSTVVSNQKTDLEPVKGTAWIFNSQSECAKSWLQCHRETPVVFCDTIRSDTGFLGRVEHLLSLPLGYLNSPRVTSKIESMVLSRNNMG